VHVIQGLRQALVMLLVGAAVAAAAGGFWALVQDSGFRVPFAVALMVIGGVLSLTGGTTFSRSDSMDARAFLGMGLDNSEVDTGRSLTGVGVFLFVSLPLFVVGLVLFGTG
jgi:hypothetical protein